MKLIPAVAFTLLFIAMQFGFEYAVPSIWARILFASLFGGILGAFLTNNMRK